MEDNNIILVEKKKSIKDWFKEIPSILRNFFISFGRAFIFLFTHPIKYLKKYKTGLIKLAPLFSLILLFLLYLLVYSIKSTRAFGSYEFQMIINQGSIVAVVATGAIFIYSLGAFDIALGASAAIGALSGMIVYNKTGNLFLFFIVAIATCAAVGIFDAMLSSIFRLPVFVVTVAMLSILTALIQVFLNGNPSLLMNGEYYTPFREKMNATWVRILIVGVFFLATMFIFNFTKIGKKNKFIGGNMVAAKQTGINLGLQILITFIISGIGVGLGAMIIVSRASTITVSTGVSVGMDVLMAIVFGGMPMAGGAKSKVSAGIIGAFSITIFSLLLNLFQLGQGWEQLLKALLFLGIVLLSTISHRTKLLSR